MKELEGEIQTDLKIQPGTENSEGHLSGLSLFLPSESKHVKGAVK